MIRWVRLGDEAVVSGTHEVRRVSTGTTAPEQPVQSDRVTLITTRDGLVTDEGDDDRPGGGAAGRAQPLATYRRLAVLVDVFAVLVAGTAAYWIHSLIPQAIHDPEWVYRTAAIGLVLAWVTVLSFGGAYDVRFLGVGSEEFKRVAVGTFLVFGIVASVSFLFKAGFSRGYVLTAMPVGLACLLLGRGILRRGLHRQRREGSHLNRTLVVGEAHACLALTRALEADPLAGFRVVAMFEPPSRDGGSVESWLDMLERHIASGEVDAVALTQSPRISNELVKRLAWRLEGPRVDLLVAPSLGDIGGPRLTIRPVTGLPLIHLDEPRLTGPKRFAKRAFDLMVASVLVALLSPLLVLIAILVKSTSHGPVSFRQVRIGQNGRPFRVFKFRTMNDGAQDRQAEVWAQAQTYDGTANKSRNDPRVTAIGRFLRRWSLDELPQLFNILVGSMSIVGPRPVQPLEADEMPEHHNRRHLTKPGLTGLWQISGRNETSWDERMRLDLYYVENWSITLDAMVLLKTVKAVVSGHGAY